MLKSVVIDMGPTCCVYDSYLFQRYISLEFNTQYDCNLHATNKWTYRRHHHHRIKLPKTNTNIKSNSDFPVENCICIRQSNYN